MSDHIKVILSSIIFWKIFCVELFYQGECTYIGSKNFSDALISLKCMDYGEIENGNVTIIDADDIQILHFTCLPGYQIIGRPKIMCGDGQWESVPKPKCVRGCGEPPMLENGEVKIENYKTKDTFDEGVTAIYKCIRGFQLDPPGSKYRVCQGGKWNGSEVNCRFTGCSSPPLLTNGYFNSESSGMFGPHYVTDERVHYTCNRGYKLEGPSLIQCQASGAWSPDLLPQCIRYPPELQKMCQPPPPLQHVVFTVVRGLHTANTALAGTTLKASCKNGYRDEHSPCEPQRLQCIDGSWEGQIPNCVPVFECMYPLAIPNANIVSLQLNYHYPLGSSAVYTCLAGYDLVGNSTFKCKANGCWDPEALPVCHPQQTSHIYFKPEAWSEYLNINTFLFISMVSTFSVMFILLSVCVVVVCRHHHCAHHHHHRRNGAPQPTLVPPPPDTDRVALIAFAESVQSVLPSYEEAMRMNGGGTTGILNYRVHRPHWTMVGAQRNRNIRQVPSAGESMGSIDTMTVSEVSTNITLDTVSSHTCSSGSQTASCRAICGSLASFDTNSALNTEGAPLLEENEMEEAVAGTQQNVHELDSGSIKLQPDIAS